MFSYSTGYYVSPPVDQYLKFKNRCSLLYTVNKAVATQFLCSLNNEQNTPFTKESFHRHIQYIQTVFLNFLKSPGIDSASLCSLADWKDNTIPTQFLAPIDCSKILATGQYHHVHIKRVWKINSFWGFLPVYYLTILYLAELYVALKILYDKQKNSEYGKYKICGYEKILTRFTFVYYCRYYSIIVKEI